MCNERRPQRRIKIFFNLRRCIFAFTKVFFCTFENKIHIKTVQIPYKNRTNIVFTLFVRFNFKLKKQ